MCPKKQQSRIHIRLHCHFLFSFLYFRDTRLSQKDHSFLPRDFFCRRNQPWSYYFDIPALRDCHHHQSYHFRIDFCSDCGCCFLRFPDSDCGCCSGYHPYFDCGCYSGHYQNSDYGCCSGHYQNSGYGCCYSTGFWNYSENSDFWNYFLAFSRLLSLFKAFLSGWNDKESMCVFF